jgi:hypothetical protein
MTPLFKKLNWKGASPIVVVNAPASFAPELAALEGVTILSAPEADQPISFALAFVTTQADLDHWATTLTAQAPGDATLWFAYPKGSSKNYTCEFNRDSGWYVLGAAGFEGVRQVAIDADWSALRFRRVAYIKTLTRDPSRARSAAGKARTTRD